MKNNMVDILFEDKNIIVCVKPVGVSSQVERGYGEDMVSILMNHLHEDGCKNPYIGVIHRLDKMVGGIMVYAKNKESASKLSAQVASKAMVKKYYAILCQNMKESNGKLTDYLVKDGKLNMSRVVKEGEKDAKKAELIYSVCEEKEGLFLADITLLTGRHHQIRVQFASRGCALYGDAKYNKDFNDEMKDKGLALFSYYLEFKHPITNKKVSYSIKPHSDIFNIFFK